MNQLELHRILISITAPGLWRHRTRTAEGENKDAKGYSATDTSASYLHNQRKAMSKWDPLSEAL